MDLPLPVPQPAIDRAVPEAQALCTLHMYLAGGTLAVSTRS